MAEERFAMPDDMPDFVREAEEAKAGTSRRRPYFWRSQTRPHG